MITPNFNFDLCRLAITILDELKFKDVDEKFIDFIKSLTKGKDDTYLYELDDDFNMYIEIAKKANNSRPCEVIKNEIFNKFKVKKKQFPKKSYYGS